MMQQLENVASPIENFYCIQLRMSFGGEQFVFCVASITAPFCFHLALIRNSFMGGLPVAFLLTHKLNTSSFSLTDKKTHTLGRNQRKVPSPSHNTISPPFHLTASI